MKKIVALAALAAAPLAAQTYELGLNISKQTYAEPSFSGVSIKEDSKTSVAGRFGVAIVDVGPVLFQFTAAYQPQTTTKATVSGLGVPFGSGDFKSGYWGAGAALTFKAVVAVGVGLEYRSEKLEDGSASTTYGRPWMRANFGYAIPSPLVKPFIGLEVAFPLAKKDLDASVTSTDDFLKTLAPKNQIGIYAGIRF